jgi:DNA-binding response OmpR family regulator
MNNVLIVEDEEFLMRVLKDSLIAEGYSVATARNGEEAIGKIEKNVPDLVMLDIVLPKADGFQVLKELKMHPVWKMIPVIMLSNLDEDRTIKHALEMGADEYFIKSQHPIQEVVDCASDYLQGAKKSKGFRGHYPLVSG